VTTGLCTLTQAAGVTTGVNTLTQAAGVTIGLSILPPGLTMLTADVTACLIYL